MALSPIHSLFDILAALCALAATVITYRWRLRSHAARIDRAGPAYAAALLLGAVAGGIGLGTLNLHLSSIGGLGRSVIGALAGAIIAVEMFKKARGIGGSTGIVFVPGFTMSIVVGRIGCYLAGVDDHTAGIATPLPWGHDFGDGVARHPVQLYESLAMLAFLVVVIVQLARRDGFFLRNGFYLMVFWYAAQRFAWEFLKPYASVVGPLNVFHLTALGLSVYAIAMMVRSEARLTGRSPEHAT